MKICKLIVALFIVVPQITNAAQPSNQVSFKGLTNFSAATQNQASAFKQDRLSNATNNRNNSSQSFENNTQLFGKVEIKNKNLKYGATLKGEGEASSNQNKGVVNADQAFIFAESEESGKFELGDNIAVNQKMKVGPASFARGNGGINGNYLKYINLPVDSQFILIAQSPIGHGGQALSGSDLNQNSIKILRNNSFNGAEDATKINYYTPRMEGLQLGVSYTPNTASSAVSSTVFNGKQNSVSDVISLGANYTNSFDNFDYAFSATAENGKSKSLNQNNLSSFDIATTMAYFGFTFGASYGSWGKSLQQKNSLNNKNSTYKTLGISYQIGHFSISLTNLKSAFQKNHYQATSLGLDYKLAKAFIPYFEVTQFSFKPNQSQNLSAKNQVFVGLAGFLFSF